MKQRALDLESKNLDANIRAPTYKMDCHFLRPCNCIRIFYPQVQKVGILLMKKQA